ncbi:MAG: hypothetical protein ACE5F1_06115 [Planctomycetota bacterium]
MTVSGLLCVWGAANEHSSDGVLPGVSIDDLDEIARIPGLGRALESVGWAVVDEEQNVVSLPNFREWNTPRKSRSKTDAERSREYRKRKRAREAAVEEASDTVTKTSRKRHVTRHAREDEMREEKRREEEDSEARDGFCPPEDLQRAAEEVRDHYVTEVFKGQPDQTRTSALTQIRFLCEAFSVEDLKLAATRYSTELPETDRRPLGCRNFYLQTWEEYLAPDWKPPPTEPERRLNPETGLFERVR